MSLADLQRVFLLKSLGLPLNTSLSISDLQSLYNQTSPPVPGNKSSRSIADINTDNIIANTIAESVLGSFNIPTTVIAGDVLRAVFTGEVFNNTGGAVNLTFKPYVGTTAVMTSNPASIATNATQVRTFRLAMDVTVINPTNDQRTSVDVMINGATTGFLIGSGTLSGSGRGTSAEDLTTGKTISLASILGTASALATITLKEAFFEVNKRLT